MIRFLQRHRTIGRHLSRGPFRSWVSHRVWAELQSDPVFVAGLDDGLADLKAGRFVRFEP